MAERSTLPHLKRIRSQRPMIPVGFRTVRRVQHAWPDDLKATLDRSFADGMWSKDRAISRAAWDSSKAVVMEAGILKMDVAYDDIIDMSFVESVRKTI